MKTMKIGSGGFSLGGSPTLTKGVPARAWRFANNSPVRRDGGGYWLRAS
ncbi:hypothetical protein SAMN05880593_1341 [Rhizobium sp. RU36D]|nr:hypothetical protein SAMN05880593_1341 [Rhizobium sp. RU36D]